MTAAASLQELRRKQLVEDLGRLVNERWGRRLFYVLTRELGRTHEPVFVGDVDQATAAWRDGRKSLALEVQDIVIRTYPSLFADAMEEQQQEIESLRARDEAARAEGKTSAAHRKNP